MPEKSTPKGEHTRDLILDAAYHLFIGQGYHATSIRQIADQVGMAPGGIYNHFPSKEVIFETILEERHPFIKIIPIMKSVEGSTVEEYVQNAARSMVTQLGQFDDLINLNLIELVEFDGIHIQRMFEKITPDIVVILQRLNSEPDKLRDLTPTLVTRSFMGLFFSYAITQRFIGDWLPISDKDGALDGFVEIFLHGILKSEA